MNKKGFTLVELLAVMSVLSLILVLVIGNVSSVRLKGVEKLKETEKSSIIEAALSFYQDYNGADIDTLNKTVCKVKIETLKEEKFLNVNEFLNENITVDSLVKITNDKGNLSAQIMTSDEDIAYCTAKNANDFFQNLVKDANKSSTEEINLGDKEDCTNTLAYDGTEDNNLRYVGSNPCNYVSFNNELWRIVGIFNNIEGGKKSPATRIKLVRKNQIGYYSYDTSDASLGSNGNYGKGINDWSKSDLMNELNGDYLDSDNTADSKWYNGENNQKNGYFYARSRLKKDALKLIDDSKWYLGGISDYEINSKKPNDVYAIERGTKVIGTVNQCNDNACPRAISWNGKIALLYIADYIFASGGSERPGCLNLSLWNYSECKAGNYLRNIKTSYVFLNPSLEYPSSVITKISSGEVGRSGSPASSSFSIIPTIYLDSDVYVSEGEGSISNPYIFTK